ncbi:MAG: NdvB protein, partial [Myxococcota bacterium]
GATLEDTLQRGQLPNYLPNYYRGAIEQFPETAGRSSHLFNTGAASWLYRIVIEELYGLRGCRAGLRVSPKLPVAWKEARLRRRFREATLEVRFERSSSCEDMELFVDGERIEGAVIPNCLLGTAEVLDVRVVLPEPKG